MTNIRSIDMLLLEDIFDMGSGYVLNFSDRTFATFFREELSIDINEPKYATNGGSKAKRLRHFLQTADRAIVVKTLKALWEYREIVRQRACQEEKIQNARDNLNAIITKLAGSNATASSPSKGAGDGTVVDAAKYSLLQADLLNLSKLDAQPRGYAFEKFLKQLFDTFGLEARDAFRLRGEQIDGSFVLGNETYLLEAKWQGPQTGNGELHAFHGKLEQKAAWARGLFISYSGFTEDGLHAFGRGKRVICMDGWDLSEALTRQLPLTKVLDQKVRRAAETGMAFVRIGDLFGS